MAAPTAQSEYIDFRHINLQLLGNFPIANIPQNGKVSNFLTPRKFKGCSCLTTPFVTLHQLYQYEVKNYVGDEDKAAGKVNDSLENHHNWGQLEVLFVTDTNLSQNQRDHLSLAAFWSYYYRLAIAHTQYVPKYQKVQLEVYLKGLQEISRHFKLQNALSYIQRIKAAINITRNFKRPARY